MWLAIGDAVEHWARYLPDKVAMKVGYRQYTFWQLYQRAATIRAFVSNMGSEGRTGIAVTDKFEYLACLIGLNLLGRSVVILNPFATDESLAVHLVDTAPSIVIGQKARVNALQCNNHQKMHLLDIAEIREIPSEGVLQRAQTEEWGVLFSSGSTGVSKAIVYNHLAMTSELLAWILELGIRRDTAFYVGRPIYYTGGLVVALATLLVGGCTVMPSDRLDGDFEAIWMHYQESLQSAPVHFAFFIPDQIRMFMKLAQNPCGGPTILTMGAPISGTEKKAAHRILKSPIVESWGNSEGLGTITDPEDLFARPNSVGRPFLTERICVVREDLTQCGVGESGRLAGSAETMFIEYANRPDATDRVKKASLVLSDDIGYMDRDHYFYILGRDQESFVIDGRAIFLSDLDRQVQEVEGVQDASVVAVEEAAGPKFYAVVSLTANTPESTVADHVLNVLDTTISGFVFVPQLPRLASGKIDRLAAQRMVKSRDAERTVDPDNSTGLQAI